MQYIAKITIVDRSRILLGGGAVVGDTVNLVLEKKSLMPVVPLAVTLASILVDWATPEKKQNETPMHVCTHSHMHAHKHTTRMHACMHACIDHRLTGTAGCGTSCYGRN